MERAAAAAQAAARHEASGQLQEAAAEYEVAARGLMQVMRTGSLAPPQLASFRERASQYVARIEDIRSKSVLPCEPPLAASQPVRTGAIPEVVVVPEPAPTVQPEPELADQATSGLPPSGPTMGDHNDSAPAPAARPDDAKLRRRRFHILQEILCTERTFVQTLHQLFECYYQPMHRAVYSDAAAAPEHDSFSVELPKGAAGATSDSPPPELSAPEFNRLFHPSLLRILRCQDELLEKLEAAWVAQAHPNDAAAPDYTEQFEEFLPQLSLYADYIGNYKKAAALHSSLAAGAGGITKREQLAAFEQSVERAGAAPLSSSLITPVQRLTRYEMLFKELLLHTADSDKRARVERVLGGIAETNVAINELLRAQSRVAHAAELLASLLHPPPPTSALAWLGEGEGLQGLKRKSWTVATRAYDPPDPRQLPVEVVKGGVARVQAGEVLELLQIDGGPGPQWLRVRRCSLVDTSGAEPGMEDNEGWILSECTKRVHAEQVAQWLEQARGRACIWATAAHRVLSRLRNVDADSSGGSELLGRELLCDAMLQEWDPLRRRVLPRRFTMLSGCLLKLDEVPNQGQAQRGTSAKNRSRLRLSCAAAVDKDSGSSGTLRYCDSIDLTDDGVAVTSWGMGFGLKIQVASCVGDGLSQKQWDMYFETVEEAQNWAELLNREIAQGHARRQATGVALPGSSLTAPVCPLPFLLADDEPSQQLFPDTLVPC